MCRLEKFRVYSTQCISSPVGFVGLTIRSPKSRISKHFNALLKICLRNPLSQHTSSSLITHSITLPLSLSSILSLKVEMTALEKTNFVKSLSSSDENGINTIR